MVGLIELRFDIYFHDPETITDAHAHFEVCHSKAFIPRFVTLLRRCLLYLQNAIAFSVDFSNDTPRGCPNAASAKISSCQLVTTSYPSPQILWPSLSRYSVGHSIALYYTRFWHFDHQGSQPCTIRPNQFHETGIWANSYDDLSRHT
jgi:hypothetical protein